MSYFVGNYFFEKLADAVAFAVAESANSKRCQITKLFKNGIYGYAGQTSVVASFFNGADLNALACDEDGNPDFLVRKTSLT